MESIHRTVCDYLREKTARRVLLLPRQLSMLFFDAVIWNHHFRVSLSSDKEYIFQSFQLVLLLRTIGKKHSLFVMFLMFFKLNLQTKDKLSSIPNWLQNMWMTNQWTRSETLTFDPSKEVENWDNIAQCSDHKTC